MSHYVSLCVPTLHKIDDFRIHLDFILTCKKAKVYKASGHVVKLSDNSS